MNQAQTCKQKSRASRLLKITRTSHPPQLNPSEYPSPSPSPPPSTSRNLLRNTVWETTRYFTPEQKYHQFCHSVRSKGTDAIQQVLDRIYRIVDEGGPFDGIFANSEGATIVANFLVSPSWDILSLVYSQNFQYSQTIRHHHYGGTPRR